jgi:hypothetical protein
LESLFRWASKQFVKKDEYGQIFYLLDRSLDDVQRRFLFYLLSKIQREYLRKNQRQIAFWNVFQQERGDGLA